MGTAKSGASDWSAVSLGRGIMKPTLVTAAYRDVSTCFEKQFGCRQSYAGRAAGDDGGMALKVDLHPVSLSCLLTAGW